MSRTTLATIHLGALRRNLARVRERVLERREALDEAGAALEELRELVGGQLPR